MLICSVLYANVNAVLWTPYGIEFPGLATGLVMKSHGWRVDCVIG